VDKLRQHVAFWVGSTYARVITPTEIIAALGAAKLLPVAAVRAGTECADAIAPSVLAVVEKASGGALAWNSMASESADGGVVISYAVEPTASPSGRSSLRTSTLG